MELEKKDIFEIGEYVFEEENGCISIACSPVTAHLERIMLRNILLLYGDYKITNGTGEFFDWDDENGDDALYVKFTTNFPVEIYNNNK